MNYFFRLRIISIIVLGMTAPSVNAYTFNGPWCTQVTGAFIGIEGLDLQPRNGDLNYVDLFPTHPGGSFIIKSIKPSYDWSWRIYTGLKFTGNEDLTLSWTQIRTNDKNSVIPTITGTGFLDGISVPRWFTAGPWEHINGRVTFNLDDAYAVWGHRFDFHKLWSIRLAGGFEYTNLKSKLKVTEDILSAGVDTIGYEGTSKLNGFGPRLETDVIYGLPRGFALFAKFNAATIISHRDVVLEPINANPEDPSEELPAFNYPTNKHVIIPKLGMRLGASYSYIWGQAGSEGVCCRINVLTIDAGWQAESFIHAIERPIDGFDEPVLGLQPSPLINSTTKVSNFGDQGFFIGIKFSSDWFN